MRRSKLALVLFLIALGFIAALLYYAVAVERENWFIVGALLAAATPFTLGGWVVQIRKQRSR